MSFSSSSPSRAAEKIVSSLSVTSSRESSSAIESTCIVSYQEWCFNAPIVKSLLLILFRFELANIVERARQILPIPGLNSFRVSEVFPFVEGVLDVAFV